MIPRHNIDIQFSSILKAVFAGKKSRDLLEERLVSFFGKPILFFQSGRAGFYWLFRALSQKNVFLPAYTCSVVADAAKLAGKKVIFVDIDLENYAMDIADLKKKLVKDCIVVMTHQFGIPIDVQKLARLVKKKSGVVVEDCAAAFGARYGKTRAGTSGIASVFSFEYTKVIAGGRGGFVVLNDSILHQQLLRTIEREESVHSGPIGGWKILLRILAYKLVTLPVLYDLFIRFYYSRKGFTEDQGTRIPVKDHLYDPGIYRQEVSIALDNFKRRDGLQNRRNEIAQRYCDGLNDVPGIALPVFPENARCSLMRFPLRIVSMKKKDFFERALSRGLDLGFSFAYTLSEKCPKSRTAARQMVNLPMNANITDKQVAKVISIVKSIMEKK